MQYLIATTFEVVHYIVLQAVHYKPLQEVHLSRYNHHSSRVKGFLPEYGQVGILSITVKQFGNMELFSQSKQMEKKDAYIQLELF